MIQHTQGIVLHQVKYGETSIITTIFTEQFGRQSYIINGIRSSKGRSKLAHFQPLNLLELEVYHKPGRDIQRIKDYRLEQAYTSISFDIIKQSISLFIAEFLYRTIKVEDHEKQLFDFVHSSILAFDALHEGTANFHLWFLLRLTKFLGIYPENNYSTVEPWFNIKTSRFDQFKPHFPENISAESSKIIAEMFELPLNELANTHTTGEIRNETLQLLVDYYHLHFDALGTIRSIDVLKEIFR